VGDDSDKKKPKSRRVGQVLERGPNKWLIRIFVGYKPNGQNDYFNKTIHDTKTEAEKWLRGAHQQEVRNGLKPYKPGAEPKGPTIDVVP
jgi:hypothetical protein